MSIGSRAPFRDAPAGRVCGAAGVWRSMPRCSWRSRPSSGAVLQAFGLYAEGYYTWSPLHAAAAKALFALLLVHMAVHAGSLYNLLKRRGVAKAAAHDDGGFDDERRSV